MQVGAAVARAAGVIGEHVVVDLGRDVARGRGQSQDGVERGLAALDRDQHRLGDRIGELPDLIVRGAGRGLHVARSGGNLIGRVGRVARTGSGVPRTGCGQRQLERLRARASEQTR